MNEKIQFTLGGSALLFTQQLVEDFNDIDLLTDDDEAAVVNALQIFNPKKIPPQGIFCSDYFYQFEFEGVKFDLMGRLALLSEGRKIYIQSIKTGEWQDIPLGSMEQWRLAYELMGRRKF